MSHQGWLEDLSGSHQLRRARIRSPGRLGIAFDTCLFRNEGSAAHLAHNHLLQFECVERLADRRAGSAEFIREMALRRNAMTFAIVTAGQPVPDVFTQLREDVHVAFRENM